MHAHTHAHTHARARAATPCSQPKRTVTVRKRLGESAVEFGGLGGELVHAKSGRGNAIGTGCLHQSIDRSINVRVCVSVQFVYQESVRRHNLAEATLSATASEAI